MGDLLPVFDALHSAREGLAAAGEGRRRLDAVRQGLDLVEKELLKVLGRHGVERIEAAGAPSIRPCTRRCSSWTIRTREPSTVAQVLRPGFTLHGRVVRPAHVSVTRAAENRAEAAADADDAAQDED